MATSVGFCIAAVDDDETFFEHSLSFVVRKLAALPADLPASGKDFILPLMLLFDGRLFHFDKRLHHKPAVAKSGLFKMRAT
jgi:hypothetical protein